MSKARPPATSASPNLFGTVGFARRRTRSLILPRFLASAATDVQLIDADQDRAFEILKKWTDLEKQGHLAKKETALDASFLHEVFGKALGYSTATEKPDDYRLERNFTVPGVGTADGALGVFGTGRPPRPHVAIELKGAATDLDRDKFNGRTPVQQCWDYLNAMPDCPWGIVSNFAVTRLYHRNKTPQVYQEFRLQDLGKREVFNQFYYLFEVGGFIRGITGASPRALQLLEKTETRQREVGDELYSNYSDNRYSLIRHLCVDHGKTLNAAIHVAQKILDRIIFIAFCEDRGLLNENCLQITYESIPPITRVTNPRWRNFVELFGAIDKGVPNDPFL